MCSHYDVQPGLEPEWETDPFELVATDGYYYGRGVTDNKGPVLAAIYAVGAGCSAGQRLVRELVGRRSPKPLALANPHP